MRKKCPNCGSEKFIVTWHVAQSVVVDGEGRFIEELSTDEIDYEANDEDIWTCAVCGADAPGSKFNVGGEIVDYLYLPSVAEIGTEIPICFLKTGHLWYLRDHVATDFLFGDRDVLFVDGNGNIIVSGETLHDAYCGVRPVFKLLVPTVCSGEFEVGNTVKYGDNLWIVCNKDSDNSQVTLISKNNLVSRRFDDWSNDYMKSDVRRWLNEGAVFKIFSEEERSRIIPQMFNEKGERIS